MKAFRRKRTYSPGDILAIHQHGDSASVRGSFVARTRHHWELAKHSIEAGGVYNESLHERVLVPVANVSLVEVTPR